MDNKTTQNGNSFSILSQDILNRLKDLNITEPTKVQDKIIPIINEGKSVVFESEMKISLS